MSSLPDRSRFTVLDPLEDTETIRIPALQATRERFTVLDPLEDTETICYRISPMEIPGIHCTRSVRGY